RRFVHRGVHYTRADGAQGYVVVLPTRQPLSPAKSASRPRGTLLARPAGHARAAVALVALARRRACAHPRRRLRRVASRQRAAPATDRGGDECRAEGAQGADPAGPLPPAWP